ncbi:hypothetical protein BCR42DRAFT_391881 [Absidia repens]|uniref:Uncharacterized protein n=1 Tax=Absidia repens TaxID=90262 RepID=A0A1X2IIB4_9FUNG|nr:hypothetical protein BCR42DRAFT_391881 [Absidia repens]
MWKIEELGVDGFSAFNLTNRDNKHKNLQARFGRKVNVGQDIQKRIYKDFGDTSMVYIMQLAGTSALGKKAPGRIIVLALLVIPTTIIISYPVRLKSLRDHMYERT